MYLKQKYKKLKLKLFKKYKKINDSNNVINVPTPLLINDPNRVNNDDYIRWIIYVYGHEKFMKKVINNNKINCEFNNIRIQGDNSSGLILILLGDSFNIKDRNIEEQLFYNVFENENYSKNKIVIYTGPSEQKITDLQKIKANNTIIKILLDQNEKLLLRN